MGQDELRGEYKHTVSNDKVHTFLNALKNKSKSELYGMVPAFKFMCISWVKEAALRWVYRDKDEQCDSADIWVIVRGSWGGGETRALWLWEAKVVIITEQHSR